MGKINGSPNAEARAEAVARVDDVPGTYAPDSYWSVSSISWSGSSFSSYNRLHHDHRFLFDLRGHSAPQSSKSTAHSPQQYEQKLVQATKVWESALHVLLWKEQKITREQLRLEAQSGSVEDFQAYILWEKKGKMLQSRAMPVLYEHAIESADSKQWAAIWAADETQLAGAETALRGFGRTT